MGLNRKCREWNKSYGTKFKNFIWELLFVDVKVKSFYEKAWFAWLMLFLFFPVGLVLLWKYSHHSTWVRGSISFIFAVMIMSSLIVNILHPEISSAKTDEKVTASAQKAGEVPKESVPDAYFFGLLDFSVDKKSGDLTYIFHNNTSNPIQLVNITGKWLDNNGNIVGEYGDSIRNLASGDKYKAKSIIPKEATSIRLETLNVSEQYVSSGDYKVKKIDLTSIVPVSSLSELKKSSHSYFVTTGFSPQSNLKNEQEAFKRYDKEYYKQLKNYSDITKQWKNIFQLLGSDGIGQQEAIMQLRECEKKVGKLQGDFSSIKIPGEIRPEQQKLLSLSLEKMNISLNHYMNLVKYGIKWTETKGDKEWIKKMETESSLSDIFMMQSITKYIEVGDALKVERSDYMQ